MNLNACSSLITGPENRVWYRAIHPRHWQQALATAHTGLIPSRYNPGTATKQALEVLYLAEDHNVALFEVGALLGSPLPGSHYLPNPRHTWLILNVQVTLQAVADLTLVTEHNKLGTTAQELTGDWRCYGLRNASVSVSLPTGLAPTQALGQAIHNLKKKKIEAFRSISARVPTHMNLVVFRNRLRSGSTIVYTNPNTGEKLVLGPKKPG